jgi:hypothetical protein
VGLETVIVAKSMESNIQTYKDIKTQSDAVLHFLQHLDIEMVDSVLEPNRTYQHTRQTLQSTLWYCSQFLTVIFFVAMLPKHLAHCLFRFAPQPKSQANTQHSNKKTLHSNHHHRSAYASIKTA